MCCRENLMKAVVLISFTDCEKTISANVSVFCGAGFWSSLKSVVLTIHYLEKIDYLLPGPKCLLLSSPQAKMLLFLSSPWAKMLAFIFSLGQNACFYLLPGPKCLFLSSPQAKMLVFKICMYKFIIYICQLSEWLNLSLIWM